MFPKGTDWQFKYGSWITKYVCLCSSYNNAHSAISELYNVHAFYGCQPVSWYAFLVWTSTVKPYSSRLLTPVSPHKFLGTRRPTASALATSRVSAPASLCAHFSNSRLLLRIRVRLQLQWRVISKNCLTSWYLLKLLADYVHLFLMSHFCLYFNTVY